MNINRWFLPILLGLALAVPVILAVGYLGYRLGILQSSLIPTVPVNVITPQATATVGPIATELPPTETPTEVPSSPTATLPPTETATLPPTITAAPTNTPPPTATATPAPTLTPTPVPIPCNWAQFVSDVTVPDGSIFAPNAEFTKTWKLKNIGTCTWTTQYALVFSSGASLANKKQSVVELPHNVKPGENVEISVKMTAPDKAGTYISNWMLRSADGKLFATGTKADKAVFVTIKVLNVHPGAAFDFSLLACQAQWRNSHNDVLSCAGNTADKKGVVTLLEAPRLENRNEDEPALWVRPDNRYQGQVFGRYPAYKVKAGDHFRAWVGCLQDNQGCNVIFELKYRQGNGNVQTLGKWTEVYDGSITEIDLDLSALAGETVEFILSVTANNFKPEKANAFWFVPRIENVSTSGQ